MVKIIGLMLAIIGTALILIFGNWQTALGVFIVIWANNMSLLNRRE